MNLHFPYEHDAAFIGALGPDVALELIGMLRTAIARYADLAQRFDEKCYRVRELEDAAVSIEAMVP